MKHIRQATMLALGVVLSVAGLFAAACGGSDGGQLSGPGSGNPRMPSGNPTCGTTKAVFAQSPVALSDFFGWVPLGNMGPPGHTFPTDHQYLYINDPAQAARREVNIVAPSDIIITHAKLGTSNPGSVTDYTLEFTPCAEVYAQFGHVLTIAPAILSQLGAFDQFCNTYSPAPGASVTACETKAVAIKVSAGTILGTAGGASPHSFALDFSLWDARITALSFANPSHWTASQDHFDQFHIVPASDYFTEPVSSQIAARLGSFDGKIRRTVAPIGGTIGVDVPGTPMGFWFNPSQPTYPESAHLAIAPDNVDPTRIAISIGTSLPGWNQGLVWFTPNSSGFVNRNPSQITADGNIYCFELPGSWVVLTKLVDANTLRVESSTAFVKSCAGAQPWAFSASAFDYKR